ncbi:beta-ketoacyl synthase [Aureococcus anophagefferens]|nr:beta-ketoacyl synthase [Aureococcus anophagefferens]
MLSPTLRCRFGDDAADGYVRGEGVGVDGRSNGLTAPNPAAQGAVLAAAYADFSAADAAAARATVAVIEAHGTGTRLGDPIELGALGGADLGAGATLRCASIKASIGHLEGCSGLAGLAKAASVAQGRARAPHRSAAALVGGEGLDVLAAKLEKVASSYEPPANGADRKRAPALCLAFTGQGAAYVGMGRALYESCAAFRCAFDAAAAAVAPLLEGGLEALETAALGPAAGAAEADDGAAAALLTSPAASQPALFCFEYALAKLVLAEVGREQPDAVVGHSLGEVAAFCAAGVLPLDAAPSSSSARRAMSSLAAGVGAMAAVRADAAAVAEALDAIPADVRGDVQVAADNSGLGCTLSGRREAVDGVLFALADAKVGSGAPKKLRVLTGFHSACVDPCLVRLRAAAADLGAAAPGACKVFSTCTGAELDAPPDAAYWPPSRSRSAPRGAAPKRFVVVTPEATAARGRGRRPAAPGLLRSARREADLVASPVALRTLELGKDFEPKVALALAIASDAATTARTTARRTAAWTPSPRSGRRGSAAAVLVAVQWGPWAGHGMASGAKNQGGGSEAAPFAPLLADEALNCLDFALAKSAALESGLAEVAVVRFDFDMLAKGAAAAPHLAATCAELGVGAPPRKPKKEKREAVDAAAEVLRVVAAHTTESGALSAATPLGSLALDSLEVMAIVRDVNTATGARLSVVDVLGAATLGDVAGLCPKHVGDSADSDDDDEASSGDGPDPEAALAALKDAAHGAGVDLRDFEGDVAALRWRDAKKFVDDLERALGRPVDASRVLGCASAEDVVRALCRGPRGGSGAAAEKAPPAPKDPRSEIVTIVQKHASSEVAVSAKTKVAALDLDSLEVMAIVRDLNAATGAGISVVDVLQATSLEDLIARAERAEKPEAPAPVVAVPVVKKGKAPKAVEGRVDDRRREVKDLREPSAAYRLLFTILCQFLGMQIAFGGAVPVAWLERVAPARFKLVPKLWIFEAIAGCRVAEFLEVLLPYPEVVYPGLPRGFFRRFDFDSVFAPNWDWYSHWTGQQFHPGLAWIATFTFELSVTVAVYFLLWCIGCHVASALAKWIVVGKMRAGVFPIWESGFGWRTALYVNGVQASFVQPIISFVATFPLLIFFFKSGLHATHPLLFSACVMVGYHAKTLFEGWLSLPVARLIQIWAFGWKGLERGGIYDLDESFVARDKLCRLFVAKAVPVLENYVVYTGAMNYAWRALGAKIGSKGVVLSELFGQAYLPGLVSVDDGAYVAAKVFTNPIRARADLAFADGVSIGKGAFVGPLSILMPGAVLRTARRRGRRR